ncbi:MAG: dihydrofolate reductase [Bacteroidota bacterium]
MDIIIIAAISDNMALGIKGGLPWDMPADRTFLLEKIQGKFQIMGRRSYEEIVETNFFMASFHAVLTRNSELVIRDGQTFSSYQAALDVASERGEDEVIVLGGGQVYKQTINQATRLILTEIHTVVEADTFFPSVDPEIWQEVKRESHKADTENAFDYDFVWYERKDT